jgi:hypothetical protein
MKAALRPECTCPRWCQGSNTNASSWRCSRRGKSASPDRPLPTARRSPQTAMNKRPPCCRAIFHSLLTSVCRFSWDCAAITRPLSPPTACLREVAEGLAVRTDVGVPRQPAPVCLCTQQRASSQPRPILRRASRRCPVSRWPRRGVAAQGSPDAAQHMENGWKLAGSARDGTANCWHAMLRLCVAWKGREREAEA